jgi:hypothetical protein
MDNQEPVVVYTVTDLGHAELVRSFLESEGIQASINAASSLPGVEDIEILVRASDADRAAQLLEEHDASQAALSEDEELGDEEDFDEDEAVE